MIYAIILLILGYGICLWVTDGPTNREVKYWYWRNFTQTIEVKIIHNYFKEGQVWNSVNGRALYIGKNKFKQIK
jgi:hypothetical protein